MAHSCFTLRLQCNGTELSHTSMGFTAACKQKLEFSPFTAGQSPFISMNRTEVAALNTNNLCPNQLEIITLNANAKKIITLHTLYG